MSTSQTLTTPGANTFTVPAGITSLAVELWGAGASGGANGVAGGNDTATGGGGGAYSKKNALTVLPGDILNYYIGNGGASASSTGRASGNDGEDTWFKTSSDVLAKAGVHGISDLSGNSPGGGAGGQTAGGIGDTKHKGGSGGSKNATAGVDAGTGGGGSAGDTTDGGDGANIGSGSGTGGTAGTTGGAAGTNGTNNGNTSAGNAPGAGSGGARSPGGTAVSGKGADGQIKVTYATVLTATISDTTTTLDTNSSYASYNLVILDVLSISDLVTVLKTIWRDATRATTVFANQAKTYLFKAGTLIGFPFALTYTNPVANQWTDQTKHTDTFTNQTKH